MFNMGQVQATPTVLEVVSLDQIEEMLARHARGDWGNVPPEDAQANADALRVGERLLSAYQIDDVRVWIITEAVDDNGQRACTTILLPEDY